MSTAHLLRYARAGLAAAVAVCTLAACQGSSFLSGSASMRIQVDVYKGALANSERIQKAQLASVVGAADDGIRDLDGQLVDSMCRIGCVTAGPRDWIPEEEPRRSDALASKPVLSRPTVEQCQDRAIAQRRRLDDNPNSLDKEASRYRPERYERADRRDTFDPVGTMQPDASLAHSKTGWPNNNNDSVLAAGSRFPEFENNAWQTCAVYERLVKQVRVLEEAIPRTQTALRCGGDPSCTSRSPRPFLFQADAPPDAAQVIDRLLHLQPIGAKTPCSSNAACSKAASDFDQSVSGLVGAASKLDAQLKTVTGNPAAASTGGYQAAYLAAASTLDAQLTAASSAMSGLRPFLDAQQSALSKNAAGGKKGAANDLDKLIKSVAQTRDTVTAAQQSLRQQIGTLQGVQAAVERNSYAAIAELAGGFRILATAVSFNLAGVLPAEHRLRFDLVKTANVASEFANQLTARANALSFQAGDDGADKLDRRALPTGQYLRDTQPTAFLDAYDWLHAAYDGADDALEPADRIRVVKRLFADDNWARINEVYASGVDKTSMAFIRDDIGNWNLKSFAADPTELTKAYTGLGIDLVTKAASLAAGGSPTALKAASGLLDTAKSAQIGQSSADLRSGALIAGLDLQDTRDRLKKELDDVASNLAAQTKAIDDQSAASPCPPPPAGSNASPGDCPAMMMKAAANLAAKSRIDAIVNEYASLIEARQHVAVAPAKTN